MRYEEETRAFNVLAGLALGIALGASIGILLSLDRRPPAAERVKRRLRKAGGQAAKRVRYLAGGAVRVPTRAADLF